MKLKQKYKIAAVAGAMATVSLLGAGSAASAATVKMGSKDPLPVSSPGTVDTTLTAASFIIDRVGTGSTGTFTLNGTIGSTSYPAFFTANLDGIDGSASTTPGITFATLALPGKTFVASSTINGGNPLVEWGLTDVYTSATKMHKTTLVFRLIGYVNNVLSDVSVQLNLDMAKIYATTGSTTTGISTLAALTFEEDARTFSTPSSIDVRIAPATPTPTAAMGGIGLMGLQLLRRRRGTV